MPRGGTPHGWETPKPVRTRYERIYVPAHKLYETSTGARKRAEIVIDNNDVTAPMIRRKSD